MFHLKPSRGWLRAYTKLGRGLVGRGKTTDVLNQFLPEIFKVIPMWTLQFFIIREPLLLFFEQNKGIHNSQVNEVGKNGFPPSQTLPLNIVHSQDLMCSIYGIHIMIIGLECQWLLYLIIDIPDTSLFLFAFHLELFICIGGSRNHGYHLLVHPLHSKDRGVPFPPHSSPGLPISPLLAIFQTCQGVFPVFQDGASKEQFG